MPWLICNRANDPSGSVKLPKSVDGFNSRLLFKDRSLWSIASAGL